LARVVETWLEHLGVAAGGNQSLLEEIRSEVAVRSSEPFYASCGGERLHSVVDASAAPIASMADFSRRWLVTPEAWSNLSKQINSEFQPDLKKSFKSFFDNALVQSVHSHEHYLFCLYQPSVMRL
jgi:hypothetical protein